MRGELTEVVHSWPYLVGLGRTQEFTFLRHPTILIQVTTDHTLKDIETI